MSRAEMYRIMAMTHDVIAKTPEPRSERVYPLSGSVEKLSREKLDETK